MNGLSLGKSGRAGRESTAAGVEPWAEVLRALLQVPGLEGSSNK